MMRKSITLVELIMFALLMPMFMVGYGIVYIINIMIVFINKFWQIDFYITYTILYQIK